ncbi:hypothetical protein Q2T40_17160 [Winogradskyella maritima]|uniref:Lipoprotein n=1 Tax=Winogradskyella maritima TaxID=1517766 RepID=A0ABV8AHN3_9FLAO|nr:hypothetical protein [Winogradskyella maritima]
MEIKNIIIFISILFVSSCASQKDSKLININLEDYQKYASHYVDEKYLEISKIEDSIIQKHTSSLIAIEHKRTDLDIYSCPIFKLNNVTEDYSKVKNFISLIDFSDAFEKQVIFIYDEDILISMHSVNANYKFSGIQKQTDEFEFLTNSFLIHKNEFVTGLPFDLTEVYTYKEKLEKENFVFFIDGMDTYFILKNNTIYAVQMKLPKNPSDYKTFESYFNDLKPEFIEINHFLKKYDISLIYDETTMEVVSNFQKHYPKKIKDLNILLKTEN